MKILVVLTSHDKLGNTGEKTGFWLEELAAPYYAMKDAGVEITLASPKGGQPPLDPKSNQPDFQTDATRRFENDAEAKNRLANTVKLADVHAADYDAVFYPGGHGPLWDLAEDKKSIALIESFVLANKPVAAVCHAPAVLLHVKTIGDEPWIKGKQLTAFSNSEEDAVGLSDVVPFLLEDALKQRGANFEKGDDWSSFVITDGILITGQNPASSEATAKALLKQLA
ncbi:MULTISPECIES: type 1 glutamine amidotransferase domain-containing protein [unclassified Methylophaga]|jgi:putative intracellular protease/amidase|uniref:type 1 glutamine amidotransferase domain-containing protein n=1 Tax=unclassified Methylophaga TaxID=2629249 RepID=UPI000C4E6AE5|nr:MULTISPECIES: type 1 glutamine amidotransferase domain-containing protein [unclassified Methylophaga]MAL50139.1 type 1 glutamine amidotransferase domain-containing protein [Methylophaga sp.]MAP25698.1 type 1 glutamine amidotransferase domain-containing protein [Methylophaga sp.]MBP25057.1 type 1 glutamine amidotransferase domain-containing protein [Methylophaga sp.]HAD30237.1 type 1 glutamine amidotransferase domain-containing protein [Methylophaga sp.]HBX58835.1 type 1 glutamine amidotrans|tara:strand:- start:10465 stop:11142 length:678 start_codon:yes stop_codon:yes gene_type:complete